MTCEDIDAPCHQCVYCDNYPFSVPCKDNGFAFKCFIKKEGDKMENIFKLDELEGLIDKSKRPSFSL